MPKLKLPMMVQDPAFRPLGNVKLLDTVNLEDEFFLDGPISKRVALLDFDENTGALRPGVRYIPPRPGRTTGDYEIADRTDATSRDLLAVSVFATVWKTIQLFESADALGRRLRWAFDGPQLLVVPRAGRKANAFYQRSSRSLQFFYFNSNENPEQTIFSCASRDIVAHETAHAIVDGILPDIYGAVTPQALALHEAIADLTALLSSFACNELTSAVLAESEGKIDRPSAFSAIAEEFGVGRGNKDSLRSLVNRKSLDPDAGDDYVPRHEAHLLSEVLSGALYAVMVAVYAQWREKFDAEKALGIASRQFRRMIYRALDYAPPGEISFADYGRAILAADQAHHPEADDGGGRAELVKEFVSRGIVPDASHLDVKTNFELSSAAKMDVELIAKSDWAAYEFANQNRALFGIPKKIPFRVLPRVDSTKRHHHRDGERAEVRELIFKVSWDTKEPQSIGPGFPKNRQITVGTTLVVDWNTRIVRSLLHGMYAAEKANRDALLAHLVATDRLRLGDDSATLRTEERAIHADVLGDLMRVHETARMLHIAR
jgi:hypothetical protein